MELVHQIYSRPIPADFEVPLDGRHVTEILTADTIPAESEVHNRVIDKVPSVRMPRDIGQVLE
jgi:hypothetical protein